MNRIYSVMTVNAERKILPSQNIPKGKKLKSILYVCLRR